ncbi:MAG: prepilin peptidase [Micrococcales bacterium]
MPDFIYLIALAGFAVASLWLTITDMREKRLPNKVVWPLNAFLAIMLGIHGLLANTLDSYLRAILAGAACFVVFFALRFFSPKSMGFGDVKLSIAIGLMLGYLGWMQLLNGIFFGFIAAAIFAIGGLLARKLTMKGSLAFGPFMLLGAWIALLF